MKLRTESGKETSVNLLFYIFFLLIACTGMIYGQSIRGNYSFLRVWEFQNVLVLLLGVPCLFIQSRIELPDFMASNVPNRQRFLIPVLIGAVFGILDVLVIKILLHPEPYTELPPFLQPFPYSIFLYFSGALEIEVFYRLIPLSIILLIGKSYKNGRNFQTFLWVGIILTAFREPLEQLPDGGITFIFYSFVTGFLMNLMQAIYFKKAGFIASLTLRSGHYLFWHILLGIYVQYVEL
jgi:hypothetical protein